MLIATWNVNSVKIRMERLLPWLGSVAPDVVCLQEIKTIDSGFPLEELQAAGYHCAVYGQKTYNGVAILSKTPLEAVERGFLDGSEEDPQARLLAATILGIRVVCVYVPNGSELGSDKYAYKQSWLTRLTRYLQVPGRLQQPLVLCGDLNIAPDERDVHDPALWSETVLFHPEIRARFQELIGLGLVDTLRLHKAEGGIFSWWDFRNLGFPKNLGLRIDHILATPDLAAVCTSARVERDLRKGQKPSDHAPVVAEFDWPSVSGGPSPG